MLNWCCVTWNKTWGCLHVSYRNSTHRGDSNLPKAPVSRRPLCLYESLRLHRQGCSFIPWKNVFHCLRPRHESKTNEQESHPVSFSDVQVCGKPPLRHPQCSISSWPVHLLPVGSEWPYLHGGEKEPHSLLPSTCWCGPCAGLSSPGW